MTLIQRDVKITDAPCSDFSLVAENLARHTLDMFIDGKEGWVLSDYWEQEGFTVLEFEK